MTNEKRLKRLQADLEWLQTAEAKHIARNLGIHWDDEDPDISAVQDACPDFSDPIGNIQNVIDDIRNNEYGTISHLLRPEDEVADDFDGREASGDSKDGYSVQVFDKVSKMAFWLDVYISDRDVACDWNQYIFHTDDEDDMKRQKMQENCDFFSDAESAACAYLEKIGAIIQDENGEWRYGTTEKEGGK